MEHVHYIETCVNLSANLTFITCTEDNKGSNSPLEVKQAGLLMFVIAVLTWPPAEILALMFILTYCMLIISTVCKLHC